MTRRLGAEVAGDGADTEDEEVRWWLTWHGCAVALGAQQLAGGSSHDGGEGGVKQGEGDEAKVVTWMRSPRHIKDGQRWEESGDDSGLLDGGDKGRRTDDGRVSTR